MTKLHVWALVMDGAHALFYTRGSLMEPWRPLASMEQEIPPERELAREPGHSVESVGEARHRVGDDGKERRALKRHLAARAVERLEQGLQAGAFEQLLVAAPPATLSDLRQLMGPKLATCVRAENALDLTGLPQHELQVRLDGMLAATRSPS